MRLMRPADAIWIALLLYVLYLPLAAAQSGERVALVIGNQRYAFAPLDTPEADARAMTDRLRRAGYEVARHYNLKQSELYDAVDTFFARHKNAKVIAFFYAGHAVQLNGKNFLVPIGINKEDPDILSRMFDLRYLINKLTEARAETKLVMLDACRDNIFSSNPNAASGLSELIAPSGTFVAFSTAPGSTAEDGDGDNSPYTTALLESLFRPGVKIEEAFKEVRRKVRFLTENAQTPWESTSLVQDFYVVPPGHTMKPSLSLSSENKDAKPLSIKPASRSLSVAQEGDVNSDKKVCSRLLAKISMGMEQLSEVETASLAKCRH